MHAINWKQQMLLKTAITMLCPKAILPSRNTCRFEWCFCDGPVGSHIKPSGRSNRTPSWPGDGSGRWRRSFVGGKRSSFSPGFFSPPIKSATTPPKQARHYGCNSVTMATLISLATRGACPNFRLLASFPLDCRVCCPSRDCSGAIIRVGFLTYDSL